MNNTRKYQLILVLVLPIGCSGRVDPPKDIKVNPNPSEVYLVTLYFDKSVSGINDVSASNSYYIEDKSLRKCSPKYELIAVGEFWTPIQKSIDVNFGPTSENKYQVVFVPNYFLDEPYYQMDTCHWKSGGVNFQFKKNRFAYAETKNFAYHASISYEDIIKSSNLIVECDWPNKDWGEISRRCSVIDEKQNTPSYPVFRLSVKINKIL